jgi:hypothetical protein
MLLEIRNRRPRHRPLDIPWDITDPGLILSRIDHEMNMIRHQHIRPELERMRISRCIKCLNEPAATAVATQQRPVMKATKRQRMGVTGCVLTATSLVLLYSVSHSALRHHMNGAAVHSLEDMAAQRLAMPPRRILHPDITKAA